MIWYILTVGIVIGILLDIHTLVKAKPSFKSAFKMTFNMHIEQMLTFWWMHFTLIWLLMYIGVSYLLKESSDMNVITMAIGFTVSLHIILGGYIGIFLYGLLKKRDKELFEWVFRIKKEGFWKYTEDEKKYIEQYNAEYKAKLRRWFPFLVKFDKKVI